MVYVSKSSEELGEVLLGPSEIVLHPSEFATSDPSTIGLAILDLLSDYFEIQPFIGSGKLGSTIDQAKEYIRQERLRSGTHERKNELMRIRRLQFRERRAELELRLIDRDGYVCRYEGCECQANLTIDHIVPLSKGGTDEVSNLQFLCRSHNSRKSDGSDNI